MYLSISAAIGLVAALLMFAGDMALYFTDEPYEVEGGIQPYLGIMKRVPVWRLTLGGVLGPISAFFYCLGFTHLYLAVQPGWRVLGLAVTLLLSFGIVVGGAYHSHYSYIGLIGRTESGQMRPIWSRT